MLKQKPAVSKAAGSLDYYEPLERETGDDCARSADQRNNTGCRRGIRSLIRIDDPETAGIDAQAILRWLNGWIGGRRKADWASIRIRQIGPVEGVHEFTPDEQGVPAFRTEARGNRYTASRPLDKSRLWGMVPRLLDSERHPCKGCSCGCR